MASETYFVAQVKIPLKSRSNQSLDNDVQQQSPLEAFMQSFHLLATRDMALLAVVIAYTGFELTFFSGVYGTSVGNIKNIMDRKRQIGLVGMLIGAGEITGGLLFGIFGQKTNRYGRDPIVLLGFLVHMVTFYLIFLNVPDDAPKHETEANSYLNHNMAVYAICAVGLGFGDASFNTQIYSLLGRVYVNDSAPAFALFKCIQSVAAAVAFAYSTVLLLKYQLIIMVIFGFAGTITFCVVERKHANSGGYQSLKEVEDLAS